MRLSRAMMLLSVMLLGIGASATETQAQDGETWYRVQIVQVRPEKLTEFTELYRDEINPALRRGGCPGAPPGGLDSLATRMSGSSLPR